MSMQEVLAFGGRLALFLACVFAGVATWYGITRDIRGICDDLSGRRRQSELDRASLGWDRAGAGARRAEMARIAAEERTAVTEVFASDEAWDDETVVDEGMRRQDEPGFDIRHETIVCGTGDVPAGGGDAQ